MPSPRPTVEDRVRAALWFAERGFGVFSVWSTDPDGTCRCGQKAACSQPGKHPVPSIGFKAATTDPAMIRTMLSAGSEPNWGMLPPEGVLALDVDGEGVARLAALEARLGPLPPTLRTNTAHGQHLFFRWPDGLPRPIGQVHGYVTRWGTGSGQGYVIGPRSVHASGAVYAPEPGSTEIAELPRAWAESAVQRPASAPEIRIRPGGPSEVAVGSRHEYLRNQARRLVGVGLSGEALFAAVMALNAQLPEPKAPEDVRKAIGDAEHKFAPDPVEPDGRRAQQPAGPGSPLAYAPLTDFDARPVEWLWPAWIPLGVVTVMDGNPGVSKSTLVADLVARMTTARAWPDGQPFAGPPTRAVWITTEDDPGRVLRPRVEAAGGDPSRVLFVTSEVTFPDSAEPFARLLAELAAQPGGLGLAVLDPLFSHISAGVKAIADAEMRKGVMRPLQDAAERAGCAVLVVRHFSKDTHASSINRGAGSLGGIVGAARSLWTALVDPEDESGETKLVGVSKSNYARIPKAWRYAIRDHTPDGWRTTVPRVEWLSEAQESVDAAMAADPQTGDAAAALQGILEAGPLPAKTAIQRMNQAGFGRSAQKSARARLGVKPVKSGMSGGWTWALPRVSVDVEEAEEARGDSSASSSVAPARTRGGIQDRASSDSSDSSKRPKKHGPGGFPRTHAREDGRGRCPTCLRLVPLDTVGAVRPHYPDGEVGNARWGVDPCLGSARRPAPDDLPEDCLWPLDHRPAHVEGPAGPVCPICTQGPEIPEEES